MPLATEDWDKECSKQATVLFDCPKRRLAIGPLGAPWRWWTQTHKNPIHCLFSSSFFPTAPFSSPRRPLLPLLPCSLRATPVQPYVKIEIGRKKNAASPKAQGRGNANGLQWPGAQTRCGMSSALIPVMLPRHHYAYTTLCFTFQGSWPHQCNSLWPRWHFCATQPTSAHALV